MNHDEFLLDVRHDGEIFAQLETVEGEMKNATGRVSMVGLLKDFLEDHIRRLYDGKLDRDGMIRLGKALYEALFPSDIGELFETAELSAKKRFNAGEKNRRLRVIIKVDHRNRDVMTWPIEFLHPPHLDYLSTNIHIALSRQITFSKLNIAESSDAPPLKVLIVVSKPEKLGEVMTAKTVEEIVSWAEKESVQRMTEIARSDRAAPAGTSSTRKEIDIRLLGDVQGFERPPKSVIHYSEPATFQNIEAIGEDWTPHVLHFVGHGRIQDGEGEIGLITDEYDASVYWCSAEVFARLFSTWQPRLVVLQACQSAQPDTGSGFMNLASYLVKKAIPAVVAMQFEIRNDFATEFASAFYRSLAAGLDIDAAVQDGRKDLAMFNNMLWKERHFGAPVLYMISGNRIIRQEERGKSIQDKIELLRRQAEQLYELGESELAARAALRASELEQERYASVKAKVLSQQAPEETKSGTQPTFSEGSSGVRTV